MDAFTIEERRPLYPAIEPFAREHVRTPDGHEIYVEQSGNPDGYPILFVHGGPGGGTSPMQRRFFDPARYRIILFDQRGCGRSRPHASLENNTTWHLVADMELIREKFAIKRWALFGGSWGSTLALLYAETHPDRVTHLVLRGIFLMRQRELDWFYGHGTRAIFPEAWERFSALIPDDEQDDIIAAYHRRLTDPEYTGQRLMAAKEWSLWEASSVTLIPDEGQQRLSVDPEFALAFARIEAHYFVHKGFLETDNQILRDADRLAHVPTTIVQGRYDAICPPVSAFELAQAMPWATLKVVPAAGHSAFEPGIRHELIKATDNLILP